MSKLRDWFDWHIRRQVPTFTAIDFYLMLDYYDISSSTIAVIGNRKKFEWVVNELIKKLKKENKRNSQVLKISDERYLFIIDEQEISYMLIEDIHEDLPKYKIKYRKYM